MSMEIFILGLLLVIGIILILIEILFIPGTTIFGILGVISIFSSDYLSYTYFGSEIAIGYSILNSILSLIIIVYALKSDTWKKIALNKVHLEKVNKNKYDELKKGDLGLSSSSLKPYGKAIFGNKTYEVKSLENFIEENKKIKIINILQDKILVKTTK
ncbi:MAG: nodulation protein NfeD [Rhodothermaeota bacterium MED-G16]|nr:MAG: nodulation protein NfeD [Rhodothermaeota bacterium MED-G16]